MCRRRGGEGCPPGLTCVQGACRYAAPSPGALHGACGESTPCVAGSCVAGLCAPPCSAAGVCADGYECVESGDARGCLPATMEGCACALGRQPRRGSGIALLACAMACLARWRRRE